VIAITGNYYAVYSADKINPDERARSTFIDVIIPVLKASVPHFQSNQHVQGYAVEISHHILGKVIGVSMERPENLMVFLPQNAALRLLGSKRLCTSGVEPERLRSLELSNGRIDTILQQLADMIEP
jgi:hypothetical protein